MALDTGLTHLFRMDDTGLSESNQAPVPVIPLTITDPAAPGPDGDAGPVPPASGRFRSFDVKTKTFLGPPSELIITPGAGPIDTTLACWFRLDNLNGSSFGLDEKTGLSAPGRLRLGDWLLSH